MRDDVTAPLTALFGMASAVAVYDLDARLLWASEAFGATFGLDPIPIGEHLHSYADPAMNAPFFEAFEEVRRGVSPRRRVRNPSGDYRRVYDNTVTRSGDMVIVEAADVTVEIEEAETRQALESALAALFGSTPDSMIFVDVLHGAIRANGPARALYGDLDWLLRLASDLAIDAGIEQFAATPSIPDPEGTWVDLVESIARVWETGSTDDRIAPLATTDGIRMMDRAISRWEVDGQRRGVVILEADVTDYLDAMARHERLRARMDYARRMQRFAQGMAHDFGNVAQVVDGYARMLVASPSATTAEAAGRGLTNAATRAVAVSRRIATIARLEQVANENVGVAAVIRGHQQILRSTIPDAVRIDYDLPETAPAIANAEMLEGALENLVTNASQAMGGRGHLTVTVRVEPTAVLVNVQDDGPGIPPEVRERLFQPFSSGLESRGAGGTGLGLFLLREYLHSVDGEITCQSSEVGALFTIRLVGA